MEKQEKIYVAGHQGLIGSAVVRQLKAQGYTNIITRSRAEVDLLDAEQVKSFLAAEHPDYVFFCAGKSGGVYANDNYRADFIYENIAIQTNVIHQAFLTEVKKLVYFSCSVIYPKFCQQPMREEYLLTGALEPTSEPFALAKIAGMKMCESYCRQYGSDFISVIPTNTYGINQDYTPLNCLVIPALIARFHEAKAAGAEQVSVWGSGRTSRDFLFSDDLANAAIFLMNNYSDPAPINIGTGQDITIKEAAEKIAQVAGYQGEIVFDASKPGGVLVKLQDISKITGMGWRPTTSFEDGIRLCCEDYCRNHARYR